MARMLTSRRDGHSAAGTDVLRPCAEPCSLALAYGPTVTVPAVRAGVASMTALEVGFVAGLPAWRHGRLAQRFDSAGVTGKPILRHWLWDCRPRQENMVR